MGQYDRGRGNPSTLVPPNFREPLYEIGISLWLISTIPLSLTFASASASLDMILWRQLNAVFLDTPALPADALTERPWIMQSENSRNSSRRWRPSNGVLVSSVKYLVHLLQLYRWMPFLLPYLMTSLLWHLGQAISFGSIDLRRSLARGLLVLGCHAGRSSPRPALRGCAIAAGISSVGGIRRDMDTSDINGGRANSNGLPPFNVFTSI